MTQIPILSGIYTDNSADFSISYPVNLEPVVLDSGISKGHLRSASGARTLSQGNGGDRGAINWRGGCYRIQGGKLVSIAQDGTITFLGTVANDGAPVSLDYSFDRLAIASGGNLYYWDGASISQVTDPDLGKVMDMLWIDGYFMTTDGTSLIVTELNDPYAVNPLKYGSSEEDPDPVTGLMKVRGEVYAVNRNTIENFQNEGGGGFPYQRNPGGGIPKGCVGTHAKAYFLETFAFVGGGRNEASGVYLAGAGEAKKLSDSRLDDVIALLSEEEQAQIEMESRVGRDEQRLYVHLPDRSFVYLATASQQAGRPVWYELTGGTGLDQAYAPRHFVQVFDGWYCGDADGHVGVLDEGITTVFGQVQGWRFDTQFLYAEGKRAIINSIELVGLPGRAGFGSQSTVFMSTTLDGQTYSQERPIKAGGFGQRRTRVAARVGKRIDNYMGLRFRGADTGLVAWSRLEAVLEALNG